MGRWIRVRAIKKEAPNVGLYVQALIALARQLQAQEDQFNSAKASTSAKGKEADHAGS